MKSLTLLVMKMVLLSSTVYQLKIFFCWTCCVITENFLQLVLTHFQRWWTLVVTQTHTSALKWQWLVFFLLLTCYRQVKRTSGPKWMMTVCVSADDDLIGGVLKINRTFCLMEEPKHLFSSFFFISFLQLRFSLRWIFQMFSLPLQSSKLDFWCKRKREEAGCNFHLVQFFFQSYFSFARFRYILDNKYL